MMGLALQFLLGTWFICSSNFPMWLKGDKTEATFNYGIHRKANTLVDEVSYFKKGRKRTIRGVDHYRAEDSTFVWRGRGLLRLAKSEWQVVKTDPGKNWAVIYFSKTIFTPEGIDIISRSKDLSQGEIAQIKAELLKDDKLKKHVPSMRELYPDKPTQ